MAEGLLPIAALCIILYPLVVKAFISAWFAINNFIIFIFPRKEAKCNAVWLSPSVFAFMKSLNIFSFSDFSSGVNTLLSSSPRRIFVFSIIVIIMSVLSLAHALCKMVKFSASFCSQILLFLSKI